VRHIARPRDGEGDPLSVIDEHLSNHSSLRCFPISNQLIEKRKAPHRITCEVSAQSLKYHEINDASDDVLSGVPEEHCASLPIN
jgi:hypothetical protein